MRAWICSPALQRDQLLDVLPLRLPRELLNPLLRPQASTCSPGPQGRPLELLSRLLPPLNLLRPLSPLWTSSSALRALRPLLLLPRNLRLLQLQHLRRPRPHAPHLLAIQDALVLTVTRPKNCGRPRTSSSSFVKTTKQDVRTFSTLILKNVAGTRPSSSGPR